MNAAKAFGITFTVPDRLVAEYKTGYQIDIEAASGEVHHTFPTPPCSSSIRKASSVSPM